VLIAVAGWMNQRQLQIIDYIREENRPRSTQLALFIQPNPKPDWRDLSPEIQQKVLRLLALLLRQQSARSSAVQAAEEGRNE
jgi:hypothetical protein